MTTLIGMAGALIGGFLAAAMFNAHPLDEFFDISTWLTAIVGSIILLALIASSLIATTVTFFEPEPGSQRN